MEELPQLLVFALEQLKEHWQDHCRRHQLLAAENLKASHHGHTRLGVQDRVVLLQ